MNAMYFQPPLHDTPTKNRENPQIKKPTGGKAKILAIKTLATGSEIFRKKVRVNRYRNQWKLILPHGPGRRQIPIKDIGEMPE